MSQRFEKFAKLLPLACLLWGARTLGDQLGPGLRLTTTPTLLDLYPIES